MAAQTAALANRASESAALDARPLGGFRTWSPSRRSATRLGPPTSRASSAMAALDQWRRSRPARRLQTSNWGRVRDRWSAHALDASLLFGEDNLLDLPRLRLPHYHNTGALSLTLSSPIADLRLPDATTAGAVAACQFTGHRAFPGVRLTLPAAAARTPRGRLFTVTPKADEGRPRMGAARATAGGATFS